MRKLLHPATLCAAIGILAAPSPRADILPGLETFGSLTLVDSIDCTQDAQQDPIHMFRDYPAGRSYVTNILGRATRVMHHVTTAETSRGKRSGAYVSWRVGKGANIVPNDPYLLVVDYPDDAPRSVTLFNFGIATRHGYHTGFTVGESMSPQVAVPQCLESVAVPFSHEWKQLVEVVFPFERATQYNGGSRIDVATQGFDIDFVLVSQDQATDSVGLAVRSVRLYRIDDYAAAKPEIHYPAGDAPRRYVTSREEMGDNDGLASYDHPVDYYVGKARIMSLLGMNCFSKDLLEFGYLQHWGGNRRWGWGADYWAEIIDAMTVEDHYILPQYEYHGSRGDGNTPWDNGGSLGYDENYKPWTLESAAYPDRKYLFSNQSYVYNAMADMTLPQTLVDLTDLMDQTILKFKDRGNFVGAWIRSRGGMPVGFSDRTITLFNQETGRNVTRSQIWNGGVYENTPLYRAYREWWYGKRRDLFAAVRTHLATNGLPEAKFFYHSCASEGGLPPGRTGIVESADTNTLYRGKTWRQMTGLSGQTSLTAQSESYWSNSIGKDGSSWGDYEQNHASPADDYGNYTNLLNVGLSYPFNCLYTVAGNQPDQNYRNASGDLFMTRHYSLNEFCGNDYNLAEGQQAIVGYYTTDMDLAGRAVMYSELMAMAVNDPTILGYLFGSNLDRVDAPYVREFNLNFLSLPATASEVLSGGTCNDALTVRRWTTDAGDYWAVINTSTAPQETDFALGTSSNWVYRTVDWRAEPVSAGSVHLAMKPLQMVALTDIPPEGPVVAVDCLEVGSRSAMVDVAVSSIPGGAGTVTLEWAVSPDFSGAVVADARAVSQPGTYSVALSNLTPETAYYVRATLVCGAESASTVSGFVTDITRPNPEFTATLDEAGFRDATFHISVPWIGDDATSVSVTLTVDGGFGPYAVATGVTTWDDVFRTPIELDLDTEYTATVTVSNNLGHSASATIPFRTLDANGPAVELDYATAEVAADGRTAILSAHILHAYARDAILTLSVNGETVHSWTGIATGATLSWQVPAALGRVDNYEFVLASAEAELSSSVSGSFRGRRLVDWFTVAFADQGYPHGGDWTNVPASFGTWDSPPGSYAMLGVSSDRTGVSLAYSMPHDDIPNAVSYTPTSPSPPGASLRIDGRLLFSTGPLPTVPSDAFAGIASTLGENGLAFHVWANGAWHDLSSPAAIAPNAFHDWALDIELSGAEPTLTVFIDAIELSPAVSLPAGTETLRCIAYAGTGELGDFRGRLSVITPDGREYYEVTLRTGADALTFRNAGTATEQFSVGIADAVAGRWYTAFAANELHDEFYAVASTQAETDGILDLAVDTELADALFVRLVSSNTEIPLGTAFSSLGED